MNKVRKISARDQKQNAAETRRYTKIIVRDYELDMLIGIFDHEKKAVQKVVVNVEVSVKENRQWENDSIENTLNYDDIIQGIRRIASTGHINLVETFAEQIADLCLQHPLSLAVKVRVEKPDIIFEASAVGIEIAR